MPAVSCAFLSFGQGNNQIALVQLQSDANNQLINHINAPMVLQTELNIVARLAEDRNVAKPLCIILDKARNIIRNTNGYIHSSKFFAVMLVNGSLIPHFNSQLAADEFIRYDINLAVVEHTEARFYFRDYYRRLVNRTGGVFMFLEDVSTVFGSAISLVLHNGYAIREIFRRIQTGQISENVPININENEHENDGVGEMKFDHGLSE